MSKSVKIHQAVLWLGVVALIVLPIAGVPQEQVNKIVLGVDSKDGDK